MPRMQMGLFHCVAAALHIAADIQALDDVALGAGGVLLGEGVAVLVALQAAHAHLAWKWCPTGMHSTGDSPARTSGLRACRSHRRNRPWPARCSARRKPVHYPVHRLKAALGQQVFQCIGLELVSLGLCADLGVLTVRCSWGLDSSSSSGMM